ncbi:hypothetical protein EVAR_84724_1 [Eumeta japonica]|uniref:Uncharacterized protein n=1 Tax=Eumeta variegata TaxID=151549 RepID=A0A4C1VS62_EUMVA|nr:hypothetical protein EVAR_84724_1 [Eumeta japonica]
MQPCERRPDRQRRPSNKVSLLSPRKPAPRVASLHECTLVVSGFLQVWRRLMMDSVFFQTSLFSRASQCDGWLATVPDAPLPLHFIGGASVSHVEGLRRRLVLDEGREAQLAGHAADRRWSDAGGRRPDRRHASVTRVGVDLTERACRPLIKLSTRRTAAARAVRVSEPVPQPLLSL